MSRRVREGDALEAYRRLARGRCRGGAGPSDDVVIDEVEQPLRHGEAVGARVELGREVPQREVELGREHEHGQAGLEADPAVDEAHADRDGHERDPERGRELEHRAREERDPQRRHRAAPVLAR